MSAGRQVLYCCFYQIEKRDIFGGGAGQVGQISPLRHCERKQAIHLSSGENGLGGNGLLRRSRSSQ